MPTTQAVQYVKDAMTADMVLQPYVYVFYAAFMVAFIFTPVMRSVALYYGIVDKPDMLRKLHSAPVAYLGGVAVFLGWLAGVAITQFIALHQIKAGVDTQLRVPIGIVTAAFVIVSLGLWDDTRHVSPRIKIGGQLLAGVALLVHGIGTNLTGFVIQNIAVRVASRTGLDMPPDLLHAVIVVTSIALTLALVVFCCNATNLMDGLDGLCGGVTAIIAFGFVFLAVIIAQGAGNYRTLEELGNAINSDGLRVAIAIALLGGILGFVPYNFNPASIFMGDTGSMFLGFACALLMIMLGETDGKWLLAGMVMFALPVLDTSLAFARRYVAGRPFFSADRHHFHHQLVSRGLSVRKAVLVSYALTTAFVACGILIVFMRTRYAVAFYMVLFGSIIVAAYKIGMVHEQAKSVDKATNFIASGSHATSDELDTSGVLEIRKERPVAEI
ncbi:MAG TPA: MraY family glycosyltransferase [Tepidisphaeraceae bacterium]|jgi:UDP-GlcNAc:undecaprenyl-phosphate GlcNAc-1-phosphate transferase